MRNRFVVVAVACFVIAPLHAASLSDAVKKDYDEYLWPLFDHFHRNPELSLVEFKTARRMAKELRAAGFDVTEEVGGTGVVAILENGDGPLVMMRADMDALPIEENSGLPNASKAKQRDPLTGNIVPVMHACGHDAHITSLVGSARQMVARKDDWRGTLMLIVQPAEERGKGARMMREDGIWDRFGTPDYALAFHIDSNNIAGKINVQEAPYAGVDSVDIVVRGIGGHGAAPHQTKDPVVIASQIVLALQTLVARELSPRTPGVVTVGSFHAGTKHNIIPESAHLQLTVRNTGEETRDLLLTGIRRIAVNTARAAGVPDDRLPIVTVADENVPPTVNDQQLLARLRQAWTEGVGENRVISIPTKDMLGEDFPYFTTDPYIPSVYWGIGATARSDFERAANGGPPVPSQHSSRFKLEPEDTIRAGVESTVVALLELMAR